MAGPRQGSSKGIEVPSSKQKGTRDVQREAAEQLETAISNRAQTERKLPTSCTSRDSPVAARCRIMSTTLRLYSSKCSKSHTRERAACIVVVFPYHQAARGREGFYVPKNGRASARRALHTSPSLENIPSPRSENSLQSSWAKENERRPVVLRSISHRILYMGPLPNSSNLVERTSLIT